MRSQKSDVLAEIKRAGLEPHEFRWIEEENRETIQHDPSEYWCTFRQNGGYHLLEYAPGEDAEIEDVVRPAWIAARDDVATWLASLARELEAPDLWAELERERQIVGEAPGPEVENTPFTQEEQQLIGRQLNEVKEYVRQTHELPPGQLRELEARLDYLVDASSRLPRLDWRNALLGVLLGTVVEAILPGDVVRDVLSLIVRGIAHLYGHDVPGLP
jgi:hypothetical protein